MPDKKSYLYKYNCGCIVAETIFGIILSPLYAYIFDLWDWLPYCIGASVCICVILVILVILVIISNYRDNKKKNSTHADPNS